MNFEYQAHIYHFDRNESKQLALINPSIDCATQTEIQTDL